MSLQRKLALVIVNCVLLFGIFTVKFFELALDNMSKSKKLFFFSLLEQNHCMNHSFFRVKCSDSGFL